ncbi:MAG TPA: protein kinase, partial [Pirellulales bacterium]
MPHRLLEQIAAVRLAPAASIAQAAGELNLRKVTDDELLQHFVRRQLLTGYQASRLLRGETEGFYYGPYRVLYLVSEGSFARVYRVVHTETGGRQAIKVLRSTLAQKPEARERFQREGDLCRGLSHPNIVAVHDVCCDGPNPYLVLEFIEGVTLKQFIKSRGPLEPREANDLMRQIVSALYHSAGRGFAHRDLSPNNVLISGQGRIKVIDFGLALATPLHGEDDATQEVFRTVEYAALERATHAPINDPRSDVYFAGCLYYHLLTGEPPLGRGRTRAERSDPEQFSLVVPIRHLRPDLPSVVVEIVERAMQLEPQRRYSTFGEMLVQVTAAERQLQPTSRSLSQMIAQAVASQTGEVGEPSSRMEQPRVLVVESDPDWQEVLREGLKREGVRVLVYSSPEHAYSRLHDEGNPVS